MAMSRPLSAFGLAVVLLVRIEAGHAAEPDALARATALLDQRDGRAAAAILEDALPAATPEARTPILDALRRAYPLAIKQAEAEGQSRAAKNLRENLAILDRKAPGAAGPPAATQPPAPPAPPRSLSTSEPDAGGAKPEREPIPDPAVVRAVDTEQPAPVPSREPVEPAPVAGKPADIADADAAFRAKRYDEAGRIYGELARAGRLPQVRRDPWAYCRMVAVVDRINAAPQAPHDWTAIQAEIDEIRALSPKNWYAEYLRNLVAELKARGKPAGSGSVVLRGASPEEKPEDAKRSVRNRRFVAAGTPPENTAPAAPSPAPAPAPLMVSDDQAPGRPGQPIGSWRVWETPNFRILHNDLELARQVARVAESVREEQGRRWRSPLTADRWTPRCDIYLYPSAALFHQMTGQPEDSPGFSTMGLSDGRVVARRVNLRVDHPNLVAAILPHEVTHVVLADLFTDIQIPRWADEGMAVLSEPSSEQELRAADLTQPLAEGRLFRLADLMKMDYPDGRFWSLYYAQSVSLTRYLVELGTPEQFVEFVRASQRGNLDDELKRVYGIAGLADLQDRWLSHVRKRPAALASSTTDDANSARR
jgi:hypothetical protein